MVKINILINCDRLEMGGAESHITALAIQLNENGHQVYVASWAFSSPKKRVLKQNRIRLIDKSYNDLSGFLKTVRIDVIHSHQFASILESYKLAQKFNIKFGVTVHGLYDIYLDRSPLGFQVAKAVDFVIVVDYSVKNFLINIKNVPIAHDKIFLVPNGVNLEEFKPQPVSGKSKNTVSHISRYGDRKEKAALTLIKNIPEISRKLPELIFQFVGNGPYYGVIEEEVKVANKQIGRNTIRLLGERYDIPEIMANSYIILGSERVAIEGMASGRPTLLLSPKGYGGVIDQRNFKAMILTRKRHLSNYTKALINDLIKLQNQQFWEIKSRESRKIAEQFFDIRKITQKIEKIYRGKIYRGEENIDGI